MVDTAMSARLRQCATSTPNSGEPIGYSPEAQPRRANQRGHNAWLYVLPKHGSGTITRKTNFIFCLLCPTGVDTG